MKQFYTLLLFMLFLSNGNKINAQTEWSGALTTFSKADNADWTLATNQDQITSNVSITRANNRGLFNIVLESEGGQNGNGPAPSDTEWAFGNINDGVSTLTFTTWGLTHSAASGFGDPSSLIGQDMVVHLITDDIYIDIKLLSWSSGGGGSSGGGFSYERSTDQSLSTIEFELNKKIKLFPNPTSDIITLKGINSLTDVSYIHLLDNKGALLKKIGINETQVDLSSFSTGIYFIEIKHQLGSGRIKVIKQ